MKRLLILIFFVSPVLISVPACDDDNNEASCLTLFEQQLDLLQPLIDAEIAFGNDPSAQNCQDYFDVLEGIYSAL